jgi:hypothetical protein
MTGAEVTAGEEVSTAEPTKKKSLAERINCEHERAVAATEAAILHAINCGELLLRKKKQCRHGEWQQWVQEHCNFSHDTATVYMRAARAKTRGLVFSSLKNMLEFERAVKNPRVEYISFNSDLNLARFKSSEDGDPKLYGVARAALDAVARLARDVEPLDGCALVRALPPADCEKYRPYVRKLLWFLAQLTAADSELYGIAVPATDEVVQSVADNAVAVVQREGK